MLPFAEKELCAGVEEKGQGLRVRIEGKNEFRDREKFQKLKDP